MVGLEYSQSLLFTINHVFMPPQLPQEDDFKHEREQALCQSVLDAAEEFHSHLPINERHSFGPIPKLLQHFSTARRTEDLSRDQIVRSMKDMQSGDVLGFLIRAQNAAVIIRKEATMVIFESFEVSPPDEVVLETKGRIVRSFPEPAIQIPIEVFQDAKFQTELARFLAAMDNDPLDSAAVTIKAGSENPEVRDTPHPRYITQLLTEILRGMGEAAEVPRIVKRIADDVLWQNAFKPWRRSPTWLVLRVALQTTLFRINEGHAMYKAFITYLHARMLKSCLQSDLPSHLIDFMRKKTARRLFKLGSSAPSFLLEYADEVVNESETLLQGRWSEVQKEQATSLTSTWDPTTLHPAADTELTLSNSREYLIQALQEHDQEKSVKVFDPKLRPRLLGVENFESPADSLEAAFKSNDHIVALADFEQAVLMDLEDWASDDRRSGDKCESIATCMELYFETASKVYNDDPELLSVMILTLFRLWVELDRMAVSHCPLLEDFSPEIPSTLLHPLLLRTSEAMQALDHVEKYLDDRRSNAVPGQSVFSREAGNKSFGAQYYDESRDLQRLKARIEEDAERQRQDKLEELRELKSRYHDLRKTAEGLSCEYWSNGWRSGHARWCSRCSYNRQADDLTIDVHEWPLPRDPSASKIVVFELAPPDPFIIWRRITYMLLRDVCIPDPHIGLDDESYKQLSNYPALGSYHNQCSAPRIGLASRTKSYRQSHYRSQSISVASKENVCKNHGLEWYLFDDTKDEWITPQVTKCTINDHCTFRLPPGCYENLQYTVSGTSHTSNEIMANQAECSSEMTLHEYLAFARIRSGPRLQWLNIVSEIRSDSLKFQEDAVYSLIKQAIWQIGPLSGDGKREWHIEPTTRDFGQVLLSELQDLLIRLKANWCNVVGMQVITALTSRILASVKETEVIKNALSLLRDVRSVTYGWLRKLSPKLAKIKDESRMEECQMQVCEVAAACRGTYDVDRDKMSELLSTNEDIAIFVHCAILIHQNSPPNIAKANPRLRSILYRDRRLSHVMELSISQQIDDYDHGLDDSVSKIWDSYSASCGWQQLPKPNDRWITTSTGPSTPRSDHHKASQTVHLDLLTGELLIDQKPLGRLPKNMVVHPIYSRIFGQRVLDVIPADMSGMDYQATLKVGASPGDSKAKREATCGYQVFFAWRHSDSENHEDQLVIRAQREDEVLELIPHHVFEGDLPTTLVKDSTHWLNVSTRKGDIEIRDLKTPWNSSADNWRIHFSPNGGSDMYKGVTNQGTSPKLVDPRSPTVSMISKLLQPLEDRAYILVTHSSSTGRVDISLPRFRLEFFLQGSDMESLSIPGMVVDNNQCSGTMIGLKSQLVLRAKDSPEPWVRQVIIPFSPSCRFTVLAANHHVRTSTLIPTDPVVRYFKYTINSTLGRIEGDGSMLSKLYQVYLHAMTSHPLPDPLTGRTGTEEALLELRSAGLISFQKLGEHEWGLLLKIRELTPVRTYYPAHLQVMQSVRWSIHSLSALSQHNDFEALSDSILGYAEMLGMFGSSDTKTPLLEPRQTSKHLIDRAKLQNGPYYRDQTNGQGAPCSNEHDRVYKSRGSSMYTSDSDEGAVCSISAMVFNWESQLLTESQLYQTLKKCGKLFGINEKVSLEYSHDWLKRDMAKFFLSVCNACRRASFAENRFQMVFSFSAWAYGSVNMQRMIPTILAFATVPKLRTRDPPVWSSYDLSAGVEPTENKLSEIVLEWARECDARSGSDHRELERKISMFNQRRSAQEKQLINILRKQWPDSSPVVPKTQDWLFDIRRVEEGVAEVFQTWLQNKDLYDYIGNIQEILDGVRCHSMTESNAYKFDPIAQASPSVSTTFSFRHLVEEREAPDVLPPPTPLRNSFRIDKEANVHLTVKLRALLDALHGSVSHFHKDEKLAAVKRQYADDLEKSLRSLLTEAQAPTCQRGLSLSQMTPIVLDYQRLCEVHLQTTHARIQESLLPLIKAEHLVYSSGLWPCLTIRSLLKALTFDFNAQLPKPWRKTLNTFAHSILAFQHACRLSKLLHEQRPEEFSSEFGNTVIEAGDDEQYSTRLLIQIDGDFLTRPIQIDFTREMTIPRSERNTVLQLNMGEGKSSVIAPLVAATLSDGQKLVRIVVLKPLAPAMFQLLVHRLGGLANRRVFFMPFSRTPQLTLDQARQVQDVLRLCVQERGILVAQPEHILSFKLMGLDRKFDLRPSTSAVESSVADHLLDCQRWLDFNSRDILDESDEILHVKYQLVYTLGLQQPLDGSPDRWTIAQQVLNLVKKHAKTVECEYPDDLEVLENIKKPAETEDHEYPEDSNAMQNNCGSYPRIRILQERAGKMLIDLIVGDISGGALHQCSFDLLPSDLRTLAISYITNLDVAPKNIIPLKDHCKDSQFWQTLLILRGLLAHGILLFVFKEKRWRVDYGLDPSRTMLAVPYRAKDVPSMRAEFSHPDIAILLTCLSYYWKGLTGNQLAMCFEVLFKQDNPSLEYHQWVHLNPSIPKSLRHVGGINVHDLEQRKTLLRLFGLNQSVIDFYLSNVVFPRSAKEFPKKMATSAWDLAERKQHVTTGFSGTNDGQYLLPTSIEQADPLSQSSTNAKVLAYLLQPENNRYQCMVHGNSEQSLLHLLSTQERDIRVLLDVGAQIIQLSNEDVAKEWLKSNTNQDILAIIFFRPDDEPYVRTRDGVTEALVSSPFRQQLHRCLLYLDDAHTRGTDFKLPMGTRAAVTLGPKLTKDRLLQGCMRMRKLGRGHSVMFFAPCEVDRRVRLAAKLHDDSPVEVKDILLWTMLESCLEVVHRIPQWAQQGIDYRRREQTWNELEGIHHPHLSALKSTWTQKEAQSLEQMYGLVRSDSFARRLHPSQNFQDISDRYQKWAPSTLSSEARVDEEQEREMVLEMEMERQVELPPKGNAVIPCVHDDVRSLVKSGRFSSSSSAFFPLFQPLSRDSEDMELSFEADSWKSRQLFCTKDFSTTVESTQDGNTNDYIRPVQWIISTTGPGRKIFIVMSPHEVNELLPLIRQSTKVHLHQYGPRVTQEMKSFEDLAFHCIPPLGSSWLKPEIGVITRLNLWAGQLYIEDEGAYIYLCNFLGLYSQKPTEDDNLQPDGFIKPEHRKSSALSTCTFEQSQVPYLRRLFALRRKGMGYFSTHMGKILRGRLLENDDFC